MTSFDILCDESNKAHEEIPEYIFKMTNLRMLYLEGNHIKLLPENFFPYLPNITWLDLRNNQLEEIPSNIMDHKNLQTLLIQNNKLEFLPNELGVVPTLQMVQLSGNPILYPPQDILDGGTRCMLDYLKAQHDKLSQASQETLPDSILEKESEIKGGVISRVSSYAPSSKISIFSEPLKRSPRSATLSITTMPVISVKSLSRTNVPKNDSVQTQIQPATEADVLEKDITGPKKHTIIRQCPKFTVTSSFVNGNKSIQTVMKFKAKGGKIDENWLKEIWMKKLKELLADQEKLIQQEKNLRSLNEWRMKRKLEPKRLPSTEEIIIPPYATESEYSKILSRSDLRGHIEKLNKQRSEVSLKPPTNIDKLMDDVLSQLKNIENTHGPRETMTPRTKIQSSEDEIKAILNLHKRIASLQVVNSQY